MPMRRIAEGSSWPHSAVTVEDQRARRLIVGECLAKLVGHPICRRVRCDTDVDQHSSGMMDDEEDVEYPEGDGRDRKEVHCGGDLAVVGENGAPWLPCVGMSPVPGHGARDWAFGDLRAELLDLAVDARRSRRRSLGVHSVYDGTDVGPCARSSSATTRVSAPGRSEALAMPADDGLGLVDGERLLPSRPPAAQGQPEESIGRAETRSRLLPSEDGELLSEREVLQAQVGPAV